MKIGFDAKRIYHNRTGLGNYSRDLVRIMARYYCDNEYLLYNPKLSNNRLFDLPSTNVVEKRPKYGFASFFNNLWRQKFICRDLRKDNIDIFHGLTGEVPLGIKELEIPVVVTIHDLIFLRYPQFYTVFDRNIHKLKARYAVKNADIIVAVSEQTKNDIIKFFGVDAKKIRVVYQGCQDVFKQSFSSEDKRLVRSKFNLPEKFILNVGTIEERKNILAGIKAIKDIDTHLVIVGAETGYTQKVKDYITANNIESKVTFLKGVSNDELAMLYQLEEMVVFLRLAALPVFMWTQQM